MYVPGVRSIVMLVVGLALSLVFVPRIAAAQETGILELTANVDGALVYVDGELVGETPFLEILASGRHRIVVERAGFQSFDQVLSVRADTTVEIRAELLRLAPALEVRVDVDHAKVYLDGQHVGTGPLVVVDPAEAGSHKVDVEADPFGTWSTQVDLAPGVVTPVEVSLRGSLGAVAIHTDPEGATVLFDGKDYGLTPVTVDPVEVGSHWLRVSKEGYSDVLQALAVDSGRQVTVDAKLVPEGGSLVVKPSIAEATVYVNGVPLGSGRQELGPIKPGLYSLRVTAPDHTDFLKTVQVKHGGRAVANARLTSFNYSKGPRLAGGARVGQDDRPIPKRPEFWAVLGGGVGAAAVGITSAIVAATRASSNGSGYGDLVAPPETDLRYAVP